VSLPGFVATLCGWIHREQADVIAFLQEENRVLRAHLRGRCLRLSDDERRRLAVLGHRLGRATLAQVATIVKADTILRWYRGFVGRLCTNTQRWAGRPRVPAHVRALILRMATENATWGYTRIQGALKNLGHGVGRSTIARILKEHGVPPSPQRPMAWRAFVRAHCPALRDADFFTSAVPTLRGLVTYYTAVTSLHTSRTSVRFNVAPGGSLPASGHATIDH
jgi:HTH-like domain